MSQKTKFLMSIFKKLTNGKGYDQCMKNIQILSVADGKCKAQFTVAEEHLNSKGTLHGGFTSTIIDTLSTLALISCESDKPGVSVDLNVTFLKAAFPGDIVTINAETLRAGKNLAFLTVELTKNNDKDIIARGQHTKYLVPFK